MFSTLGTQGKFDDAGGEVETDMNSVGSTAFKIGTYITTIRTL